VDPHALKTTARRTESTLPENAHSHFTLRRHICSWRADSCAYRPGARGMKDCLMKEGSKGRKMALVGDNLPRRDGIATFTSDLLAGVAAAHPPSQCFSVSVNDIKGGYEYPQVVRFEIEEQDLSSYLRAADFLNISNVDIVCLQHEFGIFGG